MRRGRSRMQMPGHGIMLCAASIISATTCTVIVAVARSLTKELCVNLIGHGMSLNSSRCAGGINRALDRADRPLSSQLLFTRDGSLMAAISPGYSK